ncbi:hypothetical protein [Deferribacter abyssi]|uniref:baseplate hub domain-containing protein n=1 Tax=Deferribacter abyssi TaxID=213806 RepID=UPI003C1F0AD0
MLTLQSNVNNVLTADELITFYLYEIDYGDGVLYWTNWGEDVSYNGRIYEAQVIKHADITWSTDGKINNVVLSIGNADRVIQYYIENYELLGKQVKIIQVFADSAGIIQGSIEVTFVIESAVARKQQVDFTLSIGMDYLKSKVPARKMFAGYCRWQFKDQNCAYSGTDTSCSKTFQDCLKKGNQKRFGGFPAIVNERFYI